MATYHASSWTARVIILAIAGIFPWWYAGAQYQSQRWLLWAGLLIGGLTWLAVLCAPKRNGSCTPVTYAMIAFLGLVLLQLVPWPGFLAGTLSGANRFCVWTQSLGRFETSDPSSSSSSGASVSSAPESADWPDWLSADQHRTISIHPLQTQAALSVFAVAVIVCWSASTLFVGTRWAVALCVVLAVSGLLNSFLGVLQSVNWGRWTLLKMPSSEGGSFATFVSRNSAPPFYATAAGAAFALMGIAFREQKHKRRKEYRVTYPGTSILGRLRNRMEDVFIDLNSLAVTCICIAAFLLMAILATFSRGGVLACVGASLITLCMTLGGRSGVARASALAAVIGAVVLGALSFLELSSGLVARFDQLDQAVASGNEGRLMVWGYTLSALPSYWLTGSGLGTYRFALLPFHAGAPNVWFHHAESIPLEVLLDAGIFGCILLGWAIFHIFSQLKLQSVVQRETLLLAGAMFATVAIGIQALVDFSLILPGVFVPYLALMGAFLGRCHRVEREHARLETLGEAARDARRRVKQTTSAQDGLSDEVKHKRRSHTAVAVVSLLCVMLGWRSLDGFASAERLADAFDQYQVHDDLQVSQQSTFKALVDNRNGMLEKVTAAVSKYPRHPEVAVKAGEIQLYLWRVHAASSADWAATPTAVRWQQSNPQLLSSVLRIQDTSRTSQPPLAQVIQSLQADAEGRALAESSLQNFGRAIAGCPMDARAVWGAMNANDGRLGMHVQHRLLDMLLVLARNNPQVLGKAAITAFQDGSVREGQRLLRSVVTIWPQLLDTQQFFEAVAIHLSVPQLQELLPKEPAARARALKKLSKLTTVSPEAFKSLITEFIEMHANTQVDSPEAWMDLAWVAREAGNLQLEQQMLKRGVAQARNDFALRMALAQVYFLQGDVRAAISELEEFLRLGPSANEKTQADQQITKWKDSLDR